MDSVIFQAMAFEVNHRLAGSRLDKVTQVTSGTLVMKFWTGREKAQLLLGTEGGGAYFLTSDTYPAPARPPRFCQLLRARLRRLVDVRPEPCDRIVHLHFVGAENKNYDLVFEAFGARGNLILVDGAGKIVDLLWRQEGARSLLPGATYRLAEQQGRVSLFASKARVFPLLQAGVSQGALEKSALAPMSPALAQAIRASHQAGQSLDAIVSRLQGHFERGLFSAVQVFWDGQAGLLPCDFDEQGFTRTVKYPDLSTLVAADLAEAETRTSQDLRTRLTGIITKQRNRLHKRLQKIAAESVRQADPERYRILGNLLLANLHRCERGETSIVVEDYYQSPAVPVTITLDRQCTPQENAERYFRFYRKARRAGEHHVRRRLETEQEMEWLDQVELALEEAESGDDLYQVQRELETAGLLKQTKGQLARRAITRPEDHLHQAVTPGGWKLYWGKNSRTNDYISRNMTGPKDLWFHAKGLPGCHLVLKCGDSVDQVSEQDILHAAAYAAGYSKGKAASKVEVIVAQGGNVMKPKGARPGLVTVDSYASVMVLPRRLQD